MPAPPSKLCLLVFALQGAEDTHGAIDGCPMTNDGDVPQPQSAWRFGCRFCNWAAFLKKMLENRHDFEKRARGKRNFHKKVPQDCVCAKLLPAAVALDLVRSHPTILTYNYLCQFQFDLLTTRSIFTILKVRTCPRLRRFKPSLR